MSDAPYPDGFHGWPEADRNQHFADAAKAYRAGKGGTSAAPGKAAVVPWQALAPQAPAKPEGYQPAYRLSLNPINAQQLLTRQFLPRATILSPWLPQQGLAMIHGARGLGKTHIGLNVAYAVASGGSFLGWQADQPRRVVYIDGEMPAALLKTRFAAIVANSQKEPPSPDYFRLVASDLEPDGLPDLADPEAQRYFDDVIKDAELVIIDNLSTLARGSKENDADGWGPVQDWLLRLRRDGKSVIVIHHSGKNGNQRGTSRKEDVLDSVIGLRRPPDYNQSQGARFEVHFEKARGFFGQDAESFEARLLTDGTWHTGPIVVADDDDGIRGLAKQGLSQRDIAARTGKSKSTVDRILKRGEQ